LTPIERAVATYRVDWERGRAAQPGIAKVNPETLDEATSPEFRFDYIDITSVTRGVIDWNAVKQLNFAESPSRARRIVRHGDAMICTVRPLLGSHAYVDWHRDTVTVCSTGFAVVRCAGTLLPIFFKHLLFAEQVTRQLIAW
jgi:type I restriction enzyme, S subunit